jgi:hypothetical protein
VPKAIQPCLPKPAKRDQARRQFGSWRAATLVPVEGDAISALDYSRLATEGVRSPGKLDNRETAKSLVKAIVDQASFEKFFRTEELSDRVIKW